jgi:CO/xanthine dehydrogenase FAD-binding subunit
LGKSFSTPNKRGDDVIPPAFEYYAPKSVGEAIGLLSSLGDEAKLLAGGHSLLPMMKLRFAAPGALIHIKGPARPPISNGGS